MRMKRGFTVAVLLLVTVLIGANAATAATEGYVWMDFDRLVPWLSGTITVNTDLPGESDVWGKIGTFGIGSALFDVKDYGAQYQAYPNGGPSATYEIALSKVVGGYPATQQLSGFCIETDTLLYTGLDRWDIAPVEDAVPTRADDLKRLYTKTPSTLDEKAAFAACVWEIVHEDSGSYNLNTGDFQMQTANPGNGNPYSWADEAAWYLSHLGSTRNNDVFAVMDPNNQDFAIVIPGINATPVPEPFTMVTAFLAIGSFGMYMRKHTRRGAPSV